MDASIQINSIWDSNYDSCYEYHANDSFCDVTFKVAMWFLTTVTLGILMFLIWCGSTCWERNSSKVEVLPKPASDPKLEQHLAYAREVIRYIESLGILSGNNCGCYLRTEEKLQSGTKEFATRVRVIQKEVDDARAGIEVVDPNVPEELRIICEVAQRTIRSKRGNCEELATVAFYYMLQNHPECSFEVRCLEKSSIHPLKEKNYIADHVQMVIGEGKSSIICDPWAFRLAVNTPENIFNYRSGLDTICSNPHPVPFNPGSRHFEDLDYDEVEIETIRYKWRDGAIVKT